MRLAADAQRERTVLTLRRAYLDGRLEPEEFAERAGRALSARTTRDLRLLVRDLPHLADQSKALAFAAARVAVLVALALLRLTIVLLVRLTRAALRSAAGVPARLHGRA